jgi:hypothetical protein
VSTRKKKSRTRLTHFEVRRGNALRLRLAVADDAIADVGDELGALLKKIAPGAVSTSVVQANTVAIPVPFSEDGDDDDDDFIVSAEHPSDDVDYHAGIRERLAELFGSLCDTALADALEIARAEHAERERRLERGN